MSVVLTTGIACVQTDMEYGSLVSEEYGFCTQALVNLLLSGQATFDIGGKTTTRHNVYREGATHTQTPSTPTQHPPTPTTHNTHTKSTHKTSIQNSHTTPTQDNLSTHSYSHTHTQGVEVAGVLTAYSPYAETLLSEHDLTHSFSEYYTKVIQPIEVTACHLYKSDPQKLRDYLETVVDIEDHFLDDRRVSLLKKSLRTFEWEGKEELLRHLVGCHGMTVCYEVYDCDDDVIRVGIELSWRENFDLTSHCVPAFVSLCGGQ